MVFGVIKGSVMEGRVMEQTRLEADQRVGCGALLRGEGGLDPSLFAFSHCFACNFTHTSLPRSTLACYDNSNNKMNSRIQLNPISTVTL